MRLAALEETRLGDREAARATTALAIRDALAEPELAVVARRLRAPDRAWRGSARWRRSTGTISPDVLDEAVKLRLDRTIAEVALRDGRRGAAADYYRRVLDRVPEDEDALEALEGIYRKSGDDEALYEMLVRRAELAGDDTKAERELRAADRRAGRDAPRASRRGDRRLRAGAGDLAGATATRPQALDRLYTKAERWGDLTRLLEELLERGRAARARSGRHPVPAWRRSSTIGRTIARRRSSTCAWCWPAIPTTPGPSRCWRGCSTTSPCRARPPSCWSRSTRGAPTGRR